MSKKNFTNSSKHTHAASALAWKRLFHPLVLFYSANKSRTSRTHDTINCGRRKCICTLRQSMPLMRHALLWLFTERTERILLRQKFVLFLSSDKKGQNESRRRNCAAATSSLRPQFSRWSKLHPTFYWEMPGKDVDAEKTSDLINFPLLLSGRSTLLFSPLWKKPLGLRIANFGISSANQ